MAPATLGFLQHSGSLPGRPGKKRLSSGLSNRLSITIISVGARGGVLQAAFNLLDREPKGRIIVNSALDQIEGVDHGRMVAAEMLAYAGKRVAGYLTAQIHRNLPAERDTLRAFFRFEIPQANMKAIRNDPLNSLDVGFAFIGSNQVSQGLARKLNCKRRAGK